MTSFRLKNWVNVTGRFLVTNKVPSSHLATCSRLGRVADIPTICTPSPNRKRILVTDHRPSGHQEAAASFRLNPEGSLQRTEDLQNPAAVRIANVMELVDDDGA